MLEEELYEPMRMWLEQYMIDNYKGYEIITTDCHSERLDRVLAKYDIVKEQANGVDIQIDVLGIARKQGKVKLVFNDYVMITGSLNSNTTPQTLEK